MKTLTICLLQFCFILTCFAQGQYELNVSLKSVKKGVVFLRYNDSEDTVRFDNGTFSIKGKIEKPTEANLLIQHGFDLPIQLVLENGKLTISEENDSWHVSGSPNNDVLQQFRDRLYPYSHRAKLLREQSFSLIGEEQKKTLAELEKLQAQKTETALELIKSNTNFAGLLTLRGFFLKQPASVIAQYLQQFKAFKDDPFYATLQKHYNAMNKAEIGQKVADFSLANLDGTRVSLENFKGKVVLLDFWFHNCVFCRQMIPGLKNVYKDYHAKGMEIVSISVDGQDKEKEWRKAVAEDGSNWTQLWDPEKSLESLYGINGYPNLFLIDQNGNLLQKIVGYHNEAQFREILDKFLR